MGTLGANSISTLAANPHLKTIFGYPPDAAEHLVQPFEPSRFVDPQARQTFIELLDRDGGVDGSPAAPPPGRRHADLDRSLRHRVHRAAPSRSDALAVLHIEALVRDVSERKKRDDQIARRPLPDAAGREDGRARPDHLRRRARAEQSARHHPVVGRAARPSATSTTRPSRASRSSSANPSAPPASSATC